ncbi:hypothetical protein KTT_26870 [Tengunoibacter tsumagoiensis]|uniref:DUF2029 domain-containing protein n=2 Tax=Tengunoibacter tsumagoiensis TaxID=2014871 RepID=A0A402A105_9CHLR|nr:hypothetical protein KTT_26870 [Tengunoibacter tsumagoiensis]
MLRKRAHALETLLTTWFSAQTTSQSRFWLSCLFLLLLAIGFGQCFWPTTDPARYQCYALTFWFGKQATSWVPAVQCHFLPTTGPQLAFQMLPREYPPLTLLPFSLPLLFPISFYQYVFVGLMALTLLLIFWLLERFGPRGSARLFIFYSVIGAAALVLMRYDLLPALCTLLCVLFAERQRWRLSYLALAIGVLLKIYPILLFPALFLAEQRSTGRLRAPEEVTFSGQVSQFIRAIRHWQWANCVFFVVLLGAVTGFFALFNVDGAILSQVQYFVKRPLQIEAMSGSLLWLLHFVGAPWQGNIYTYGSINFVSTLADPLSRLGTLGFIIGVLVILWQQYQQRYDLLQASIALILLFVATGKVFSPQYLIWLIPLLAYAGASSGFWLLNWSLLSLLTTFIYAFFYAQVPSAIDGQIMIMPYGFFTVVFLRNALFLFITLAYLCNWFDARRRQPLASF